MKVKVIGVHSFPKKGSFKVLFDRPIDSEKMKTYGVGLVSERFCKHPELIGRFTASIGKDVNVTFDISGNIDSIA